VLRDILNRNEINITGSSYTMILPVQITEIRPQFRCKNTNPTQLLRR